MTDHDSVASFVLLWCASFWDNLSNR